MQIRVKGCDDFELIEDIKDALNFYADLLMSKRMSETLSVTVNMLSKENIRGYLAMVDWDDDNNRPKEFTIDIAKNLRYRKTLFKALAHEMVHIKQFAKGELKDLLRSGTQSFLGQEYPPNYDYWDQPWEWEAYGREVGMYVRWKKHEKQLSKNRKN